MRELKENYFFWCFEIVTELKRKAVDPAKKETNHSM